jgi:hypothetical protein
LAGSSARAATSTARRAVVLGVELSARARLPRPVVVDRGTTDWMRLSTADAQRLLREVTRLVADLPRDTGGDVVWRSGASELLVLTDRVTLELAPGLVTVGIPVGCDQLTGRGRRRAAADGTETVSVPLGVGTTKQVRGLFVSSFDRPAGPDAVTASWADALTAFAWEVLITLAQHLAAAAGRDGQGRPLVPGAIAAERGALLVLPMARNETR